MKSTLSELQPCRRQYGSIFIHLAVVASKVCKFCDNLNLQPSTAIHGHRLVPIESAYATSLVINSNFGLDWIVQCFTSPPTQYRLYARETVFTGNFGCISYRFREIGAFSSKMARFPHQAHPPLFDAA